MPTPVPFSALVASMSDLDRVHDAADTFADVLRGHGPVTRVRDPALDELSDAVKTLVSSADTLCRRHVMVVVTTSYEDSRLRTDVCPSDLLDQLLQLPSDSKVTLVMDLDACDFDAQASFPSLLVADAPDGLNIYSVGKPSVPRINVLVSSPCTLDGPFPAHDKRSGRLVDLVSTAIVQVVLADPVLRRDTLALYLSVRCWMKTMGSTRNLTLVTSCEHAVMCDDAFFSSSICSAEPCGALDSCSDATLSVRGMGGRSSFSFGQNALDCADSRDTDALPSNRLS